MTASPIGGGKPSTTSATSPMRSALATRPPRPGATRGRRATMICRGRRRMARRGRARPPAAAAAFRGSRRPPTAVPSRAAVTTSSSVTLLARSRSGSTSTWSCRSRWPQIATLATPGIAISRGRIVQRRERRQLHLRQRLGRQRRSSCTRLSDDSGDRMTGGCAAAGRRGRRCAAAAPARAAARRIRSVPSSKISTTDDRPSTDFERSVAGRARRSARSRAAR